MIISSIIVDDFYNDPHETREFALQQEFNVIGNYPGFRSKAFYNQSVVNLIQDIVFFAGGKITKWATDEYNGAFQYATQRDRSWMHADQTTKWAGVCYLTPNAPITSGTGLFKHKETANLS
jgi:outer membrane receptor for ferric coprogen and ferric-rhodotorulic acid